MNRRKTAVIGVAVGLITVAVPAGAQRSDDVVARIHAAAPPTAIRTTLAAAPRPYLRAPGRATLTGAARSAFGVAGASVDSPHQAIEHGDGYYTRLTIHRYGSYAMLPLFAGEYLLGNELLNGSDPAGWVRSAHGAGASALGILFGVNTVTGVWNLVESRKDAGALRRILHSTLMLAADAGFVYTASLASEREDDEDGFGEHGGDNRKHRNWAIGSMAVSTAGTLLMWLWPD